MRTMEEDKKNGRRGEMRKERQMKSDAECEKLDTQRLKDGGQSERDMQKDRHACRQTRIDTER